MNSNHYSNLSACEFWLKLYRSDEHCTLGPLYVFDLYHYWSSNLRLYLCILRGFSMHVHIHRSNGPCETGGSDSVEC